MRLSIFLLAAAGCEPGVSLEPLSGPMTGNFEVRATGHALATLKEPVTVAVGGVLAYGVSRDDPTTVRFTVQGSPSAGLQTVSISDGHTTVGAGPLSFSAPKAALLSRVVAMGASLTMGAQSGSMSVHGQVHGPAEQLAQSAGAYLSLPLIKDEYMPGLGLSDFNVATCQPNFTDVVTLLTQRGLQMIQKVTDSAGNIVISKVRVDPSVEARNVAIGGFNIHQVIAGAYDVTTFLEHIVWDPYASQSQLFLEPQEKMIDRVVALQPTLVISTDLFVNDYFTQDLTTSGPPCGTCVTSMTSFSADLQTILTRLDATGAHVYIATGPDITILPDYQDKVAQLIKAGYSQADATGWVVTLQKEIAAYNAELVRQAALHPNVHVVDLSATVGDLAAHGLDVNGQHLTSHRFGGLLSLDSVHFSDVGYAVLGNAFIQAINQNEGLSIPAIDLPTVMANDPFSIDALRAQGFQCAGTL